MERQMPRTGQFHHYLPRFVVRRWLQEVKTVSKPGRKSKGRRNKGHQRTRGYKQELINTYDIQSSTLHMGTTDLGKTFGIVDMYKDDADLTDVYRVEKAFSKLESDAARVFQVLEDAEKRGRSSVELVRSQLNTLRKFLFLMHYRNGRHAEQFIEGRFDPATARMVEQYRIKHGLADARAVWLRNLALLLEDEHWEVSTDERLLFTARMDYKMLSWDMQLGFYRAPSGTEFVLTENGLGLAEGARTSTSFMVELMSPGAPGPSFFPLTQSFPITPRLVVVLRSTLLTQEAALIRDGMLADRARREVYNGLSGVSYFDDFPRTPSKTTYIPPLPPNACDWLKTPEEMTAKDRQKKEDFDVRGLLDGVPLHSRPRDRFVFAIDNLTQDQAGRVNTLLLTHCKETISFLTPACLLRAIDAFEEDMMLTIFGKRRYASLKAKLVADMGQAYSPSTATSRSPTVSPEGERAPREPIATSSDPSESEPAAQAVPMGTSLPGLKGAFNRKARSAPTPSIPEVSVGDPAFLTTQTVISSEQDRFDDSHTPANVDTHVTPVDIDPHITGEPPFPPVIHDRASNKQPSAREVNVPGLAYDGFPPSLAKAALSDAALPGLRKPDVISTEGSRLIATQPLSPREPVHTSPVPSGSGPAARVIPMRTSLPGLKGAFNKRTRSAPAANIPEVSLDEPASLPTVVSPKEQDRPDDSHTQVLRTDSQITPVGFAPFASESPLPPVIHDYVSNGQPSHCTANLSDPAQDGLSPPAAEVASPASATAEQPITLDVALPGLRGAFKRKPNVISTETPSSIATQPLLASPAPQAPLSIDVSKSPDSEAWPKAGAVIDTASASASGDVEYSPLMTESKSSSESSCESMRTGLVSETPHEPSRGHPVEKYTETDIDSRDGAYQSGTRTPGSHSRLARGSVFRILWTKPAKLAKATASFFCCK